MAEMAAYGMPDFWLWKIKQTPSLRVTVTLDMKANDGYFNMAEWQCIACLDAGQCNWKQIPSSSTAQWSEGVTKPPWSFEQIEVNLSFMEAFGYILSRKVYSNIFKAWITPSNQLQKWKKCSKIRKFGKKNSGSLGQIRKSTYLIGIQFDSYQWIQGYLG